MTRPTKVFKPTNIHMITTQRKAQNGRVLSQAQRQPQTPVILAVIQSARQRPREFIFHHNPQRAI